MYKKSTHTHTHTSTRKVVIFVKTRAQSYGTFNENLPICGWICSAQELFPFFVTFTAAVKICSTATCITMNFRIVFSSPKLWHGNRQGQSAMPLKCHPMWDLPWQKNCHCKVFNACGFYFHNLHHC